MAALRLRSVHWLLALAACANAPTTAIARNSERTAQPSEGSVNNAIEPHFIGPGSGQIIPYALPGCGTGIPENQNTTPPPPDKNKYASSPGGVDMRTGAYSYRHTDIKIGGKDSAGLSFDRIFSKKIGVQHYHQSLGEFFTNNWNIQLQEKRLPRAGACYPSEYNFSINIQFGDLSEGFWADERTLDFKQTAPRGYAELNFASGGTLPNNFTFVARDGTEVEFLPMPGGYFGTNCPGTPTRCTFASRVTRPDGTIYNLDYEDVPGGSGKRLKSVISSRGYALLFEYASAIGERQRVSKVCALNLAVSALPGSQQCPASAAQVTYAYNGDVLTSATGPDQGVWQFAKTASQSFSMTKPGDSVPFMSASYKQVAGYDDFDSQAAIYSQTFATGEHYTYDWNFLTNSSGNGTVHKIVGSSSWTDSNGHGVTMTFGHYRHQSTNDPFDDTLYPTPGPESITNQLGKTWNFEYCPGASQGQICDNQTLRESTDPLGIVVSNSYDSYYRIYQRDKTPKPGSGLSAISNHTSYSTSCTSSSVLCNKPSSTTDALGHTTNYAYYSHGGMRYEEEPAGPDGIHPVTYYTYVQRYAWVKSASGGYVHGGPSIWVLATKSHCRTSSTNLSTGVCSAGASDRVVTTYDYGPNAGPNNLLLRGTVVTADGESRRTCYQYDDEGNKIAETSPRAGLGACQ